MQEARKTNDARLDLVLAPTNPKDFQVEVVLKSTNTTLGSTSDSLESTSKIIQIHEQFGRKHKIY